MTYPIDDRIDHPELQAPPTERLVPETERTLPTSKNTVLVLSVVSAVCAIAGGFVNFQLDNALVGLILAIVGLIAGIFAWVMAVGDARTGAITPAIATITAAIFSVIIALDFADIEEKGPTVSPDIRNSVPANVPENPAAIVEPKREHAGAATTQP
jgi:hypothetical protein